MKRVVVWGTGFVGKMVIAEIVDHPGFELVGVGVSSADKDGRDAGEICVRGPLVMNGYHELPEATAPAGGEDEIPEPVAPVGGEDELPEPVGRGPAG